MAKKTAKTLPFLIKVRDYHEFPYVQDTLNLVNPAIKVIELGERAGWGSKGLSKQASEMLDNLEPYIGLVYVGRFPTNAEIIRLLSSNEEIPEI